MFNHWCGFIQFHQHSLFFIFYPYGITHSLYSTVFLCPPFPMWEPVIPHRNKMKSNEYESVEHVDSDLLRMLENAKRYNVPHSSIYKRALKLQHIQQVRSTHRQLCDILRWLAIRCISPVIFVDEAKGAVTERRWRRRQHALLSHVWHQQYEKKKVCTFVSPKLLV